LADDDLLRPTLSAQRNLRGLYNSTGFFLCAFFAGPAGAGVYGIANSHRLDRLRQDTAVIVALVAAAFLALLLLHEHGAITALAQWLDVKPRRALELVLRALALGCFGAIYLLHRQFYRSAQAAGVPSQPGWRPGIAAFLMGLAANSAFFSWIL
jgi:hypothetical protein